MKENETEEVVIEAGHAYLEKLKQGEEIPAPNTETVQNAQDFLQDHGIETSLIAILDDTHSSVQQMPEEQKQELADEYLSTWKIQADSYHWESEAIEVWNQSWGQYLELDNAVDEEDSKWCDLTCAALDAAMTAEKLGITDQTSIPEADAAVTQHDENYPLPSGYSSFHGYKNQESSHQLQQELYSEDAIPVPTFQDQYNLEFNPEQVSNEELEQDLYQEVVS